MWLNMVNVSEWKSSKQHVVMFNCSIPSARWPCIITQFWSEKCGWSSRASVELWHVSVNRNAAASWQVIWLRWAWWETGFSTAVQTELPFLRITDHPAILIVSDKFVDMVLSPCWEVSQGNSFCQPYSEWKASEKHWKASTLSSVGVFVPCLWKFMK